MLNEELSHNDMNNVFATTKQYGGVYCRDKMPTLQKKFYVLNMDKSTGTGTHYAMIYNCRDKECIYVDSFGVTPPPEVEKLMKKTKKKLLSTDVQLQDISSNVCGLYAIYFAKELLKNRSLSDILLDFDITDTKANDESLIKFVSGGNLITDAWDRASSFISGKPRQRFDTTGRDILAKYGNEEIIKVIICRKPLVKAISSFLNMISFGKFKKKATELGYDQVFHLFMILEMKNGKMLQLEKNQVPQLHDKVSIDQSTTSKVIYDPKIKLNEFINKGIAMMKDNFWIYSASKWNCQNFIASILQANGILTNDLYKFIMQDAIQLFNTIPSIPKDLINKLLDLANRGDILFHGTSIKL